jgi:hypothetical protein
MAWPVWPVRRIGTESQTGAWCVSTRTRVVQLSRGPVVNWTSSSRKKTSAWRIFAK